MYVHAGVFACQVYLCAKDMYIFYKCVHVQKNVGGSESMYLGFIGLSLESVWVVCPVTCEEFIYFSRNVQNVSPVEILHPIGLDKNFKERKTCRSWRALGL